MPNTSDTILAFVREESIYDGASAIPPQPGKFMLEVMVVTSGYSGGVTCAIDPNTSAATKNNAIRTAVAAEVAAATGRTFAANNVDLAGGFA